MSNLFDPDIAKGMLLGIADILDELGIPFFLAQGTALGAYRDNGFTPSEQDIDIGVLIENLAGKQGELCKLLIEDNIELATFYRHRPSGCHTIVARVNGSKMDIIGYHKLGSERYAIAPDDVTPHYCIVHDDWLLENYQKVNLFGRVFNIPSPIETYLNREYGEWYIRRIDHTSRTRVYGYPQQKRNPH